MYRAILFAPDGDWVTDFSRDTKEGVIEALSNRGSRWHFYPFEGVIKQRVCTDASKQRVVDMAPPVGHLTNRTIKMVSEYIRLNGACFL